MSELSDLSLQFVDFPKEVGRVLWGLRFHKRLRCALGGTSACQARSHPKQTVVRPLLYRKEVPNVSYPGAFRPSAPGGAALPAAQGGHCQQPIEERDVKGGRDGRTIRGISPARHEAPARSAQQVLEPAGAIGRSRSWRDVHRSVVGAVMPPVTLFLLVRWPHARGPPVRPFAFL